MNAYAARHADCGKVVAAMVQRPENKGEIAKEVGKWIRRGDTIETVLLADLPPAEEWCSCFQK